MPDTSLRRPLESIHRRQERARLAHHVLRAGSLAVGAIAVAVAIGVVLALGVGGAWARSTLLALVLLALVALAVLATRRERLGLDAWLERAEHHFPTLRSWLRNALELESRPPTHGSGELADAVVREAVVRLKTVPLAELAPKIDVRRPALMMAGAFTLIVLLAVVLPQRTQRSWITLWSPARAAPPVRLEVEPGSVTLSPGATLAVRARVWGSHAAPRLSLDGGTHASAAAEGGTEDGARLWRFDLSQLTRETTYRVRVAEVESPRYAIRFSGAATPVGFRIEYRSPAYARLPVQAGAAARGDLSALRGSTAAIEVTFDRDLDRLDATLPDGHASRWNAITPRRWRGEVPVSHAGEYALIALARPFASGATPVTTRHAYHVTPLDDAPPTLSVRLPEGDVDLPAGQQIPLDVLAQDDLGLSDLRLEYRKDASAPWRPLPLARFGDHPREATVATRWDAAPLGLVPGELASFRLVLTDDNAVSGPGIAVSPTFTLRFPSLAELYEQVDRRQENARTTLEKAAEQARELQKSLDKLARQQPTPSGDKPPTFERAEEMKSATERQQEISRRVEDASQQLQQSLEQAAERRAFDEQLQQKLQEMNELMQQVRSEEFKDALQKMQKALEAMDRQQMEHHLDRMQKANQQMLQNLERTIALLKQLREEEKLQALAQRAEELKQQQDALNREHDAPRQGKPAAAPDPKSTLADRQREAAQKSQQLAKDAREAMKDPEAQQAKDPMEQASKTLEQDASPAQQSAAQSSDKGNDSQARQHGGRASESLAQAAKQLQQAAQQMQESEQGADLNALRRAGQDLVALQRSAEENLTSEAPLGQRGDRQTDLAEGAARVADSLQALGRRAPQLSSKLTEALGHAMNGLRRSGIEMGSGNRTRGEQMGREGATALNQAVLELRSAEQSMCNKPGNNPGGKSGRNPQTLGEIGDKQSQLNGKTQSLAKRLSQQLNMSSGDAAEMRQLAEEQARIRAELESVQRDEEQHKELLGRLDETQKDMREVEEQLRQGTSPGDLEPQQQRILSRLLDAQRSVNRRDFEPERQSRPGEDVARTSPAALPADMLRENDRLRLDLLKAETDRYPAQYRAFVEAYLRSLNGSRR